MRRRGFLGGLVGVSTLPLFGFARPDTLPLRKAVFEEVGNSVLITMSLPALIKRTDQEAISSIDSGFDTIIEYTLKVWQHSPRSLVSTRMVSVKIRYNPWKKRYVVSTRGDTGWVRRYFENRDQAIEAAVSLDRVRLCAASDLRRGENAPYYFVSVLGLRNPLRPRDDEPSQQASDRSRGRDLEWFERLVQVFAGERAEAEEIVHVRTNPFYLLAR